MVAQRRRFGSARRRIALLLSGLVAACGLPPAEALAQVFTTTESSGEVVYYDYRYDGRRNDSYQTRITAEFEGRIYYDQTFDRRFDDPVVRPGAADSGRPIAIGWRGAPAVLTWGDLELVDAYEEFLDSFTDVSVTTEGPVLVTTVQRTSGDEPDPVIYVGSRGSCFDTGVSGDTNFGAFDGQFANCDSNDQTLVNPGEINTNTHTTYVYTTVETAFTNEDYLNVSVYRRQGRARLIGLVYPGVQTGLLERGDAFLTRLDSLVLRGDAGPGAWAEAYGEDAATGRATIAGSERSAEGLRGGASLDVRGLRLGLAVDQGDSAIGVPGEPERADMDLTQVAATAGWSGASWFIQGALVRGQGDLQARHGDPGLGGVSRATVDVRLTAAGLTGGRRLARGDWWIIPAAGLSWTRITTDRFAESGGMALTAPARDLDRSTVWLGGAVGRDWRLSEGLRLSVFAQARAVGLLQGRERTLPVAFAAMPGQPLTITGQPEDAMALEGALGAELALGDRLTLQLGGDARGGEGDGGSRWRAGVSWRW